MDKFDANVFEPCLTATKTKISETNSIKRHVLTSDIFDILRDISISSGREIQLVDVINIKAKQGKVNFVLSTALCFECGYVDGFLTAISHVANVRNS